MENQRERIFGAMVACVAERGYSATSVTDLVEVSGVSSRSFYDLFADKEACFVAALESLIQAAITFIGQSVGERHGESAPAGIRLPKEPPAAPTWEEQAERGFLAYGEMIGTHTAAAWMALVESYVAGAKAVDVLEGSEAGFEELIRTIVQQSPDREGMPPELITAMIGANQEIARSRIRLGTTTELPTLCADLWELARSFRPPPKPLRASGRIPKRQGESLEGLDHAERALRALTLVVAERGYQETTVDEVLKRAQMSATTFYAHFSGKEDAMLAAIDSACAQAMAVAMPAFSRQEDWPNGIRATYTALLNFLAVHPASAHLLTVATYAAGDVAIQRRNAGLRPLIAVIENNTNAWIQMPPIVYEAIAGGVYHLLYRTVKKGTRRLPSLAPVLTYLTLYPFLGAEEASEYANGSASGRKGSGDLVPGSTFPRTNPVAFQGPLSPMLLKVRWTVAERSTQPHGRGATPAEVAAAIGAEVDVVRECLSQLVRAGVLIEQRESDAEEANYVGHLEPGHEMQWAGLSSQQISQMSAAENTDVNRYIWNLFDEDVKQSIESGVFKRRPDHIFVRIPFRVDEKGWRELTTLHASTLRATIEIQTRSAKRLRASGERGTNIRIGQLVFEMPDEDPEED